MDILNLLLLLRVSSICRQPLTDLLDAWQRSPLGRNTFRDWAVSEGPAKELEGGGLPDDGLQRVIANIRASEPG